MPGTPTYHKSVHFNDNDNQTRHFLQVDKPIAVSAGSSPVESTYESEAEYPFDSQPKRDIKLANFPGSTSFERTAQPVRVERIYLSTDRQTLIGTCAVQNISFHKLVVARFTTDYWKTTSEVVAEYHSDPRDQVADGCDRFNFHIKLSDAANIDEKTLLLCVRYVVGGQEYWDNNSNMNYQVDFIKLKPASRGTKSGVRNNTHPQSSNAIPRSRHSPSRGRGRKDHIDDDFGARLDSNSSYHFGVADTLFGDSVGSIKLKPKTKRGSLYPTANTQTSNNLGGRYDFGASLSAALTNAQEKLGRSSGLMNSNEPKNGGSYFAPQERKEGPSASDRDKPTFAGDRPAMGSDQYRDLVQKFCYFTSNTSGKAVMSPPGTTPAKTPDSKNVSEAQKDGSKDAKGVSVKFSADSSAEVMLDGASDTTVTPTISQLISRSASPAPLTGQDYSQRGQSPSDFAYPFHNKMHDGYFTEAAQMQTAIHG